ncbi:hypothetical protein [Burkholderia gladioli]|uniref:hypothetical protein n=1 Tax=Burkholderia gladioli TaxID=28095 RepID=UPI0016410894|nr:hypothetical protein [Burkholderia gladioli]MDN7812134.1 hypothetical protein [Burkholderia gladioli]
MSDIELRMAALEMAVKHLIQQLPPQHLAAAGASIDAAHAALKASPSPQRSATISEGALHRHVEQNPNYEREMVDRYTQEKALTRARALIDQWALKE